MFSFAFGTLFLLLLALALAGLSAWWSLRDRMRNLERQASESLDSQDLIDFQDKVGQLLAGLRQGAVELAEDLRRQRAGLDRELGRARDAQRRLSDSVKAVEKAESEAREGLRRWAEDLKAGAAAPKPRGPGKRRPPSAKAPAASLPSPVPAGTREVLPLARTSYLVREIRPPEPQAPVSPGASRYLKVYELADKGLGREEIAKSCGYLPGEVDLILNLRPKGPR